MNTLNNDDFSEVLLFPRKQDKTSEISLNSFNVTMASHHLLLGTQAFFRTLIQISCLTVADQLYKHSLSAPCCLLIFPMSKFINYEIE